MQISLGILLAVVALIAGILMAVGGRWSGYPLAAIAIICLALIHLLPAVGIAR